MNNISFGGNGSAYYETIGGGGGAWEEGRGTSGVHSHMTNSLNTPVESIEIDFPVVIERYLLRRGSGGPGRHRGGDGLIREYRFLQDTQVSVLSDRRHFPPYGLAGGSPGRKGQNILIRNKKKRTLKGKQNFRVGAGDRLVIKTPGGGGFGEKK
jgi:N-methylhydantoinase B